MTLRFLATIAQAAVAHDFNEARTANSTYALAIITGILVAATMVLAAYTALLWRATKKVATDAAATAKESREDAKRIREVMAAQQAAMETQATAARDQATHAETNTRILEQQFVATFRPKLVLRRITYIPPAEAGLAAKLKIQLDDVGFGGGVVTRVAFALMPSSDTAGPEPWQMVAGLQGADGDGGHPANQPVPIGGSVAFFIDYGEEGPSPLSVFASYASVYCVGYVQYTSAQRIGSYRLGFIRACDTRDRIFPARRQPRFRISGLVSCFALRPSRSTHEFLGDRYDASTRSTAMRVLRRSAPHARARLASVDRRAGPGAPWDSPVEGDHAQQDAHGGAARRKGQAGLSRVQ